MNRYLLRYQFSCLQTKVSIFTYLKSHLVQMKCLEYESVCDLISFALSFVTHSSKFNSFT